MIETTACPVCLKIERTGSTIILSTREQEQVDREKFTGWKMCPEHDAMYKDRFIALVGIDPSQSMPPLTPDTAFRTGLFMHIKADALKRLFDLPIDDADGKLQPMMFVPDEFIAAIAEKVKR